MISKNQSIYIDRVSNGFMLKTEKSHHTTTSFDEIMVFEKIQSLIEFLKIHFPEDKK